jgi:hypothetical protein
LKRFKRPSVFGRRVRQASATFLSELTFADSKLLFVTNYLSGRNNRLTPVFFNQFHKVVLDLALNLERMISGDSPGDIF